MIDINREHWQLQQLKDYLRMELQSTPDESYRRELETKIETLTIQIEPLRGKSL